MNISEGREDYSSTFLFSVGEPPQPVRLAANTAAYAVYTVGDAQGCGIDPSCDVRGGLYDYTTSNTSDDQGSFDLSLANNLGLGTGLTDYDHHRPGGEYVLDSLRFGLPNNASGTEILLENQLFVVYGTTDYYLGQLGLNPQTFNTTTYGHPYQSMMLTLRGEDKIPSLSWGYTGGQHYVSDSAYGSLTLGGFDRARFKQDTGMSWTIATDISRNLVVSIQQISSIRLKSNHTLLPEPITNVFIDTSTPFIWLPTEACRWWEVAFGLTWDEEKSLYLVNETVHDALVRDNPSIHFTLGQSLSGGPTIDIVFPYAAFDLNITRPFVNITTSHRYFPLMRGEEDQYTLGRTFLQEAYIIADYERQNFSIYQAQFVDPLAKDIVAIYPPVPPAPNDGHKKSMRISLLLGIILPTVFVTCMFCVWLWLRWKKRKLDKILPQKSMPQEIEIGIVNSLPTEGQGPAESQIDAVSIISASTVSLAAPGVPPVQNSNTH